MSNGRNFFRRGFSLLSAVALCNNVTLLGSAAKVNSLKDRYKSNVFYISMFFFIGLLWSFAGWCIRNNIFTDKKKKSVSRPLKGTVEEVPAGGNIDEVDKGNINDKIPLLPIDVALSNGTILPNSSVKSNSLKGKYKSDVFYIFLMLFLTGLSIYFIRWWTRSNNIINMFTENRKKIESYFSNAKVEKVRAVWDSEELTKRTISYKVSPGKNIVFQIFNYDRGSSNIKCILEESDVKKINDGLPAGESGKLLYSHLLDGYEDSCEVLKDLQRTKFVSSVFEKLQKFNTSKNHLFLDFSEEPLLVNFLGKNLKIESISIVSLVPKFFPVYHNKGAVDAIRYEDYAADLLVCCKSEKPGQGDYMLTDCLLDSRGDGNKITIEEMNILVDAIVSKLSENEKTNEKKINNVSKDINLS